MRRIDQHFVGHGILVSARRACRIRGPEPPEGGWRDCGRRRGRQGKEGVTRGSDRGRSRRESQNPLKDAELRKARGRAGSQSVEASREPVRRLAKSAEAGSCLIRFRTSHVLDKPMRDAGASIERSGRQLHAVDDATPKRPGPKGPQGCGAVRSHQPIRAGQPKLSSSKPDTPPSYWHLRPFGKARASAGQAPGVAGRSRPCRLRPGRLIGC